MSFSVKHFYEFGPYRLDATERLLLRDGEHVPMAPKTFETLLALVENGGHVINKEELIKKVWPDTFVEEVNLAKNVSSLRKILGGDQPEQYIETIPKRGYRFTASVKEIWDERAGSEKMVHTPAPSITYGTNGELAIMSPGAVSRQRWLPIFLTMALLIGGTAWTIFFYPRAIPPAPSLKIIPFTSFPGREIHPTFSPNGNQVAFVWNGEKGENLDLYVKLIGAGQPLRLTTDPAADTHPAWSPDGRFIAFFRQSTESSGFYIIPALGGPERKVADTSPYRSPTSGSSQYYSLDGKFLAVSDKSSQEEPLSIYLVSVDTGEKRKVTSPPVGTVGDAYPAFSPDGKTLAFIRSSSQATTDIYLLPMAGGEPRRLTFDNSSILGFAWSPHSRDIVFSSRRGSSIYNLWRIPITGGTPESLPTIGQNVISPAISRVGDRLACTQTLDDQNIWRLEINPTGKGGTPAGLIASTLGDNGPSYSPDGRKIVFASNRSGDFGIWVCDHDGTNLMQLVERGPHLTGTPRWSPDGRWIAFDSRSSDSGKEGNADIYVTGAEGGQPRRLTAEVSEDVAPSWSRDGKWVYFGSTRSGSICR
jgi:Tol biopolymer transport system component/DNA-binding winged helix-turn-helix (wHTH) protein